MATPDPAVPGHPAPAAPAPPALVWLLAVSAGATVANIYYCQPLLEVIAGAFHVNSGAASVVATATQLGYAAGMLFLVPLGDAFERKRLIVGATALSAVALGAVALAGGLRAMIVASFVVGAISVTPQFVVPYAAGLAAPERRGRIVGTVMSGLLVGILFSRTVSGFVNAHAGWRAVYWLAAGAMVALAGVLAAVLPVQRPDASPAPAGGSAPRRQGYGELLGSLAPLLVREPVLRRHALVGAMGFAAFSVFWTTLAFHLAGLPGHYGSQTVGSFALIGAVGAFVAPVAGRLADRWGPRLVNGTALAGVLAAFGLMAWGGGGSLLRLALGVVLMDAGVQASQISNQTRIYALAPALRNRLTSVYMVCYFLGGALGSAVGSWSWSRAGWPGVCAAAAGFTVAALLALFLVGHRAPGHRGVTSPP